MPTTPCPVCGWTKGHSDQCSSPMSREDEKVNHPAHYTSHPSGVECITITEWFTFNLGNVIKYCFRAGLKGDSDPITDLKKARWYIDREIARLEGLPDRGAK